MNLEAMEKEAKLFDRKNECYIHIHRVDGGAFSALLAGDPAVAFQGIYNILCMYEDEYKIDYKDILKKLKLARKICGKGEKLIIDEGKF